MPLHRLISALRNRRGISANCILGPNARLGNKAKILNGSGSTSKIIVGGSSVVDGMLYVWNNGGSIKIGDYVYIGENTRVYSADSVTIGNRVQIAHNCSIFDSNVHSLDPFERHSEFIENTTRGLNLIYDVRARPVTIKDDVWICASSLILKGVTIGERSVVGAGSIVLSDVPPDVVVAGNPARILKHLSRS